MTALPAAAKVGIVASGYFAAILLAFCVVWIYINQTSGPDRDTYGGMYAFGDSLLFLAVFGVASILPTGLALVFLRQSRRFWIALAVIALAVASTSLAAVGVVVLEQQTAGPGATFGGWGALAVLRILVSPFLAAGFGLSALIAPEARLRWYLFGAASVEGTASIYGFIHWFALVFFR
jgi:hypothetical protein